MKQIFIYTLILLFGLIQLAQANEIDHLRKSFHESVLQSDKLPIFLKEIEKINNPSALEKAYIGASEALKARESWNPIEKLIYIQKFRENLLEAVKCDSQDIEIRFLRLSIEYNIPSMLRSKKTLDEDKSLILDKLSQMNSFKIDQSFIKYILIFFEDTKTCSAEELEMIRKKLS